MKRKISIAIVLVVLVAAAIGLAIRGGMLTRFTPFTPADGAFSLSYPSQWALSSQKPDSVTFSDGPNKNMMVGVALRQGRTDESILGVMANGVKQAAKNPGESVEVAASGAWQHRVTGMFSHLVLTDAAGVHGEVLIVVGGLDERTIVLATVLSAGGEVSERDQADMAQAIDSVALTSAGLPAVATPATPATSR